MKSRRRLSRGFTLLEVLVAFAILTVSLATVFRVFSTSLSATRNGEEYAHATALARARLTEIAAAGVSEIAPASGEDDAGYRWRVDVEEMTDAPVTPSASGLVPALVAVSVEWGSGSGRSVRLSTIRAVPR